MNSLPFGKSGKWFRGNLHTHSTGSDGRKTPAQVCSLYRRRGYDFISLTDHFLEGYGWQVTDSTPYRCDGFTTIIGAELHAPKTELGMTWLVFHPARCPLARPGMDLCTSEASYFFLSRRSSS